MTPFERSYVTLLGLGLLLSGATRPAYGAPQAPTPSDSAQIIRSVWNAASPFHARLRAAVLWSPTEQDTGRFVRMSPMLRQILAQAGVPLERRRTVGDDTVVFHLTKWIADSSDAVIELQSGWTTVLGRASRPCRTGSGNVEHFRVRLRNDAWTATLEGPVIHGDRACLPIPP